jgi:hypothetical protein
MTEIGMHRCSTPDCRCKFREEDQLCFDRHYVPDPEYAHLAMGKALPRLEAMGIMGLTATASRNDVLAALGPPQESGGGARDPFLGYIKPWVKYHRADSQVRFEFGRRGQVTAVTFMPAGWRPGESPG